MIAWGMEEAALLRRTGHFVRQALAMSRTPVLQVVLRFRPTRAALGTAPFCVEITTPATQFLLYPHDSAGYGVECDGDTHTLSDTPAELAELVRHPPAVGHFVNLLIPEGWRAHSSDAFDLPLAPTAHAMAQNLLTYDVLALRAAPFLIAYYNADRDFIAPALAKVAARHP